MTDRELLDRLQDHNCEGGTGTELANSRWGDLTLERLVGTLDLASLIRGDALRAVREEIGQSLSLPRARHQPLDPLPHLVRFDVEALPDLR